MAVNVIRSINGELANCDNGHKPGENQMTMNQVIPAKLIENQLVGNPSVEEWAEWIVSRHNFCEHNAGESLREISLVALRNVESRE